MMSRLLQPQDGAAVAVENAKGRGAAVVICEHASRTIPAMLGTLGLDEATRSSHVAWDPGALALSRRLSTALDGVLFSQRFSRLVYDCNRPPDALSAMPARSEIFDIPGNLEMSEEDREARIREIYLPFRDGLAELLERRRTSGQPSVLVTVHSFTPVYFGQTREVEIGILHDGDSRLADLMLSDAQSAAAPFVVRRNAPYGPADGVTHTLLEHGIANGLANVMIEVRNDLLGDRGRFEEVATYLSGLLLRAIPILNDRAATERPERMP